MSTTTRTLSHGLSSAESERKTRFAATWAIVVAAGLAAFYFATSLYISYHRLLWADEIATVLVTRLPGWTTIWKVSTEGGMPLPPTYFMVVRLFDNLFGHSDVAVRLPSVLAMTAGMLITFDCARRLTDGLHGLIALSVLACSFLPYYGHEARSYGLYFMLAALALWVWTCTKTDKPSAAVLFGAVVFLSVTMHYYAILCLVPYAVWEIWNWKRWRPPSQKMMAGFLGVGAAAVVLWKPLQGGRHLYPSGFWSRPTFDVLLSTFSDLFPDALFLLALLVLWIAWVATKDRMISLPPMQPAERVGWFFLFIPAAGYLLAQVAHAFQIRYVICTLPGVALAFACWIWRHSQGGALRTSVGVFLILATWGVAKQVVATRDPSRGYYSPIRQVLSMEDTLRKDGKQFFVFCNQVRYLEALQYSKHPESYVLLPSMDLGDLHETMILARYYPMQFWTVEDLKKHARETALLVPGESSLNSMQQAGFEITVRYAKPVEVVYLK